MEVCWLSHTQEGQTELIHPQTFDDPFFDSIGMIYMLWVPTGQTVNKEYYFERVQEEIPSEEASTLQIGSMAFPPGQYTSPQLHPCPRLFGQDGHQDSSHPPYSPDLAPCDFCLFPKLKENFRGYRYETIEEMKEAVTKVIDTLTQEDFHEAF